MELLDAFNWINNNAVNRGDYVIVLGQNEAIPPISLYAGNRSITVTLRSDGRERSITYNTPNRPSASLFNIGIGVTFILEDGISLVGLPVDSRPLVRVNGGTLVMNGGYIRDNSLSIFMIGRGLSWDAGEQYGGGVIVENGSFVMNNGIIRGNSAMNGGGISLSGANATFIMNGGIVSDNSATSGHGGGIYSAGSFIMRGGKIKANATTGALMVNGGGVAVAGHLFTMYNGVISGNRGTVGGGVSVLGGRFTMHGGIISGNSSDGVVSRGGRLEDGRFVKTGGIIYGVNAPEGLANIPTAVTDWGFPFIWIRWTTADENQPMDNSRWRFIEDGWEEMDENMM